MQTIQVPDPTSHFGAFDAKVWLPPQYFSDPTARFPVVVLIHGNPGLNTDWLTSGDAAATALAGAKAGKPVILVMPTVLRDHSFGDSLCLDTAAQGNAETYVTQDLVAAVDGQLRTKADPTQRGIGGLSMGGYCALNLGLKHPDVYSVVLDFSGDTVPTVDTLPGGLAQLFGPNYQKSVDANTPAKYLGQLDASRGPALWIDVGQSDEALKEISGLVPLLKNKGYTCSSTPGRGRTTSRRSATPSRTPCPGPPDGSSAPPDRGAGGGRRVLVEHPGDRRRGSSTGDQGALDRGRVEVVAGQHDAFAGELRTRQALAGRVVGQGVRNVVPDHQTPPLRALPHRRASSARMTSSPTGPAPSSSVVPCTRVVPGGA